MEGSSPWSTGEKEGVLIDWNKRIADGHEEKIILVLFHPRVYTHEWEHCWNHVFRQNHMLQSHRRPNTSTWSVWFRSHRCTYDLYRCVAIWSAKRNWWMANEGHHDLFIPCWTEWSDVLKNECWCWTGLWERVRQNKGMHDEHNQARKEYLREVSKKGRERTSNWVQAPIWFLSLVR